MNWFFDSIDLSTNLERGLRAVRSIYGLPALILAIALGGICAGLIPLVWYFDIGATVDWSEQAVTTVLPTLPASLVEGAALFALALSLMPTLVELFGSRFALVGIRVAAGLVYAFSLFDAVTDYPRVNAFIEAYRPAFEQLGLFTIPALWLAKVLFLFLASFGFEMLLVVFAVCALALLLNSKRAGVVVVA